MANLESSSKDELTLRQLQQEQETLENRPHDGYADAVRATRIRSEIEVIEQRIARQKQRAAQDEGRG